VLGGQRDADARPHGDLHAVDHDGCDDRAGQPLAEHGDGDLVVHTARDDDELVATEPGHDVLGLADHLGEALRDDDEQLVAGMVTQRVVDVLEAVEVEEDHREGPLVGEQRLGALAGREPVVQAGELVAPGGTVHRAPLRDVAEAGEQEHEDAGDGQGDRTEGERT
jgi:hypothetical protein